MPDEIPHRRHVPADALVGALPPVAFLALVVSTLGCTAARSIEVPVSPRAGGPSVTLTGSLTMPPGRGPFPAVILLHGCDGLQRETSHQTVWKVLHEYAKWYVGLGYSAMVLDSFTPRGVKMVCGGGEPGPAVRALDTYAALEYLVTTGHIDPRRVILQGHSHGGWTVLTALDEQTANVAGTARRFAGGIAYYPVCVGSVERTFYAPVLILIGDRDDSTPARRCEDVHAIHERRTPGRVRLIVYPGATHGFDVSGPPRWNERGSIRMYDAVATGDASRRVEAFLREIVGQGTGQ